MTDRLLTRVAVVGAGAVGAYFGGRLAQSGLAVHFIARGATLATLRKDGLRVDSPRGDILIGPDALRVTDDPCSVGEVDAVLVAVKAWQVSQVADSLAPLLHSETVIVPLQNGVDAPDELRRVHPRAEVLGGLCRIMAQIITPGVIRHFGVEPEIMFGPLSGAPSPRTEALCTAFQKAGVRALIPSDIPAAMWEKLAFMATYGGVGAVARVPALALRRCSETRALLASALAEILAVGRARGVKLAEDTHERILSYIDALPDTGTSSLQRDIAAGRPSELEAMVGAVVRLGRAAGVPTPVFEFLYASLIPAERLARGT